MKKPDPVRRFADAGSGFVLQQGQRDRRGTAGILLCACDVTKFAMMHDNAGKEWERGIPEKLFDILYKKGKIKPWKIDKKRIYTTNNLDIEGM